MIATVTLNPALDYTVTVDGPLAEGTVTRSDEFRYDAGGKGINVTKFLNALDLPTVATAPVGGHSGAHFAALLEDAGVPLHTVEIDGQTRVNVTVHAAAGEFKVNQAGPTVEQDVVREIVDVLREHAPDTVVVAGSLPPGLDETVVDVVADAGPWETVVDIGGGSLGRLDGSYALCKPNEAELAAATGRPVETVDDAIAAAREVREEGFDRVLASLGGDGAVLVGEGEPIVQPAPSTDVVDTVGAGDSLLAGYLGSRAEGATEERALADAQEIAAAVVGVRGPAVPPALERR